MDTREQILLSTIAGITGATLADTMARDGRSRVLAFSSVALVSAAIPCVSHLISNFLAYSDRSSLSFEERLKQRNANPEPLSKR